MAVLIVLSLCQMACQQKSDSAAEVKKPAIIPGEAAGIYRVRLTAAKVEEYKLKTVPLREVPLGKVVPESAVLLDQDGAAWIFTNPQPQLFIRQSVKVKRMDSDQVILSEGPPAGTEVVTAGMDKLLGLDSE